MEDLPRKLHSFFDEQVWACICNDLKIEKGFEKVSLGVFKTLHEHLANWLSLETHDFIDENKQMILDYYKEMEE